MTEEEKRRQQSAVNGNLSQSVTQRTYGADTSEAAQTQGQQQEQTEQNTGQTETQTSTSTTTTRTSSGNVLNYDPSADEAYQQALAALLEVQKSAPSYTDKYGGDLAALYERIVNRPAFNYDINGDPLYQQYKDEYLKGGRLSMMDTMGQAAGLTGGYGSTYSQRAGQQAYDQYVQQLNSIIPQLYQDAYGRWSDEGDEMYRQYGLLGDERDFAYGQYQDDYSRWMQQVQLAQNAADQAYERGLGDWQREYAATMDKAETLADTGDFSMYVDLYGQDAADNMFKLWKFKNPLLAYQFGYISVEDYYALTGSYPPGYVDPNAGRGGGGYYPRQTQEEEPDNGDGDNGTLYEQALDMYNGGMSAGEVRAALENAANKGAINGRTAQMIADRIDKQNANKIRVGGKGH